MREQLFSYSEIYSTSDLRYNNELRPNNIFSEKYFLHHVPSTQFSTFFNDNLLYVRLRGLVIFE